jgi:hypothetical protein
MVDSGMNCFMSTDTSLNPFTSVEDCLSIPTGNIQADTWQTGRQVHPRDCSDMIIGRSGRIISLDDDGAVMVDPAGIVVVDATMAEQALAVFRRGVRIVGWQRTMLHCLGRSRRGPGRGRRLPDRISSPAPRSGLVYRCRVILPDGEPRCL